MAAVTVLISGWIGLAYATVGHIMTDSAMTQFFATWAGAGFVTLFAFGAIAALRRLAVTNALLPA